MIATFCNMRYVGVPLHAEDFSLDIDALLATIEREQPALVFLAYPNNPTGNHFDAAAIERVLRAAPGLVVIDEAYHAFARDSFLPRLGEFSNLLVMRTLSKLGLAGLRLGFLVGTADWIDQLEKLRLPYNINVLTQYATEQALQHIDVLNQQTAAIRATRSELFAALQTMPGCQPFASDANFILARVADAPALHAGLKARNILIKNLHGTHPLLNHCLRFTVGSPEENTTLLQALRAELA
jgi:histidinol-phosphate aminotransferase